MLFFDTILLTWPEGRNTHRAEAGRTKHRIHNKGGVWEVMFFPQRELDFH